MVERKLMVCNIRYQLARGDVKTTVDGQPEETKGVRRKGRW